MDNLSPARKGEIDTAVEEATMLFDRLTKEGNLEPGWRERLSPFESLNVELGHPDSVVCRVTKRPSTEGFVLLGIPNDNYWNALKRFGLAAEQSERSYTTDAWIELAHRDETREGRGKHAPLSQ